MAVDCDYYQLLGIARSANADAITAAIKKSMREWRKRTEAHDLGVRQEAEINLQRIQTAREILLNETRRRAYDAQLAGEGVAKIPTQDLSGDWLQQARDYLARGDYHSASYAAREATHTSGNSPESWWIRSRSNAGLGRLDDALYEARQAVQLDQSNAEFHFHLGCVCEDMERWNDALTEFETASRIDGTVPMYQLAIGGIYLQNKLPHKALPIIERVYQSDKEDETVCFYMASALLEVAESVPKVNRSDSYVVTSADEIATMGQLVRRALAVKHLPADLRSQATQMRDYLNRMEAKKFSPPIAALAPTSCLGVVLFIAVVLSPIWLVAASMNVMVGDGNPAGFLLLLLGVGLGILFVRLSWVPTWKVNARNYL